MTHFSLGIAASYLAADCLLIEESFVVLSAHEIDVFDEHAEMDGSGHLMRIGNEAVAVGVVKVCVLFDMVHVIHVGVGQVTVGVEHEVELLSVVDVGRVGDGGP